MIAYAPPRCFVEGAVGVRRLFPDLPGERLLFTPNFAPSGE